MNRQDLWIGDRNFCTTGLVFGIENKQAAFILRQHQNLPWQEISELVESGKTDGGYKKVSRALVSLIQMDKF